METNFTLGGGLVTTSIGGFQDNGWYVIVQTDGKILVAGESYSTVTNNYDFALVRYNSDGSLDTTFSGDGKVTTDFNAGHDHGYSVAIQSDGKVVVGGTSEYGFDDRFALARYNSDGTLDTSFGVDGKITTSIGLYHAYGRSVMIQQDGKIILAGSAWNGVDEDFALARYNSDGTPDLSFNGYGTLMTDFNLPVLDVDSSNDAGYSVAIQSDGKIVVAGQSNYINNGIMYGVLYSVARYNANGTLDGTFGVNGKVMTDIGVGQDNGRGVTVQPDGKILVVGYSYTNYSDFALVRYSSDGSLDMSFGSGGKVVTDILNDSGDFGYKIALQSDGKILVAGYTDTGGYAADGVSALFQDFVLIRYNSDGTLDTSFDGDGIVVTDFGSTGDLGFSIAIQLDGSILVAGSSGSDFALARYNTDGSLAASTSTIESASEHLSIYGVTMQQANDFLMANISFPGNIFTVSDKYDITTAMLAEIVGNNITSSDVITYFNNQGYNSDILDLSVSDYLVKHGSSLQQEYAFIMANVDSADAIYNESKTLGLTTDMLAEIVGNNFTSDDVSAYFSANGLNPISLDLLI